MAKIRARRVSDLLGGDLEREFEFLDGANLLTAAAEAGWHIAHRCRQASCGTCRLRVVAGALGGPTGPEVQLLGPTLVAAGWRLACQATVRGDAELELP